MRKVQLPEIFIEFWIVGTPQGNSDLFCAN